MEIFNAIGLKILKGKTLNDLAEDAERFGEVSLSTRDGCVIHGHCWRIGSGLEVWTIFYESAIGEISYADCRPAFRARYTQKINSWSLFEDKEEGEAALEGFTENSAVRVFFQLQNLTEIEAVNFERKSLTVGLCGLARRAAVSAVGEDFYWKHLTESRNSGAARTDWRLCGRVLDFKLLSNPRSGKNLYWIHLDLGDLALEVLVNRRTLRGANRLRVGAMIKADIWLQGHIAGQTTLHSGYEGVDWSVGTSAFWENLKKIN